MGISDLIAEFILNALDESEGSTELQRVDLASRFGCVPSQINYVISTRFSPEHGYIVESRRGGGGYIRIRRVQSDPERLLMHTINSIGDEIDLRSAVAFVSNALNNELIDNKTASIMEAAMGNYALRTVPSIERNAVRADMLKQMLLNLM